MKRSIRKFEVFAMHAHYDSPANYADIFLRLERLSIEERIYHYSPEVVIGLPIVSREADGYFIQVVEGGDDSALVLNVETGETRENILSRAELLSHATHFFAVPRRRRAAIEFSQRGAKADMIATAIEAILRENYPDMKEIGFTFAPVIRENFTREINQFGRIREAAIRMIRPNASWTDHYTDLSDLAEESGGDKVAVEIKAPRGGTLSKRAGIVKVIKDVVADSQPYLDDAKVTGVREGETNETTVHSKKHVQHTKVAVNADDAGVAVVTDIRSKLRRYLSSVVGL
ncbi:hypothetical protein [Tardiphaga sp. 813_E8_N1_3]|uniref:hypothetical protein n=1 Tax=Tardiphaga sp. 813_E8_N1_3 TaxID=3240760 RepID=UPI003F22998E